MSLLTTITPYWGRPRALRTWLESIQDASILGVKHFVFFVGEPIPSWWTAAVGNSPIYGYSVNPPEPRTSIGYFHNLGARTASTEWIMKLDVDALPNIHYFRDLLPILQYAGPREWFNGGMLLLDEMTSSRLLSLTQRPRLNADRYRMIRGLLKLGSTPQSTNFICRREDYLQAGGCSDKFKGWGWEDYQQIYALERHYLGREPFAHNSVTFDNVTRRCRDEISRRKAMELASRSEFLSLLHLWHPPGGDAYRSKEGSDHNRKVLLNYVLNRS